MSIIVAVTIEAAPEAIQKVEAENAEVLNAIIAVAMKYSISHRRLLKDDRVMDLDEFASKADYDAFIAEAGPDIERFGALIGAPVSDTIWMVEDTPLPE